MAKVVLGIDTSNYKTSVALTDENGNIRYQRSEFLKVEQGKRGLRQSVAFFHHCQVLPSFIEEAFQTVDPLQRLTRGQGVRIKILQRLNRRRGLFRGGE